MLIMPVDYESSRGQLDEMTEAEFLERLDDGPVPAGSMAAFARSIVHAAKVQSPMLDRSLRAAAAHDQRAIGEIWSEIRPILQGAAWTDESVLRMCAAIISDEPLEASFAELMLGSARRLGLSEPQLESMMDHFVHDHIL